MYYEKKSVLLRITALIMILSILTPIGASATVVDETVQPRASYYLSAYNAYIYMPGGGDVDVYFDVTGTGYMDELGVLSIEIHESTDGVNWDWIYTFNHDTTSGMLSYDDYFHASHVTYAGVRGRYYKAYVCVWGGKNGQGDTRYFWTNTERAT